MSKKQECVHTPGTGATAVNWSDPGLVRPPRPAEGSGGFDPCKVFEMLERILSQRQGVEVKLTDVRCTPEAAAREEACQASVQAAPAAVGER